MTVPIFVYFLLSRLLERPFYWSDEKQQVLIDIFQEKAYLYNTKHKDYFNRDIRNKVLNEMATEFGTTGTQRQFS